MITELIEAVRMHRDHREQTWLGFCSNYGLDPAWPHSYTIDDLIAKRLDDARKQVEEEMGKETVA